MKIDEEFGEAVQAHIGATGQNPRKGAYGSREDVLMELADVIVTAGVAMISVAGGDPEEAARRLSERLETVTARVGVLDVTGGSLAARHRVHYGDLRVGVGASGHLDRSPARADLARPVLAAPAPHNCGWPRKRSVGAC